MFNIYKIFSITITIIVLVFFVLTSFSHVKEKENNELILKQKEKVNISTGVFFENINNLDEIYYTVKNSYQKTETGNNINIKISKRGMFIFNINNLSKNYNIYYNGIIIKKGFSIKPLSGGKIFINTETFFEEPFIFSMDSIFQLSLTDKKLQTITKTVIYPHQYIKLELSKYEIGLNGVDALKLLNTFDTNGYIKYPLFPNNNLNNKISSLFNTKELYFIKESYKNISYNITNINLEYLKNISIFNEVKKENINIANLKYLSSNFFINDKKKIDIYKKVILDKIHNFIVMGNNDNLISKEVIIDIIKSIYEIKKVDNIEYNKIIKNLNYYNNLILCSSISPLNSKINFSNLYVALNGESKEINKAFLILNSIYSDFDYGKIDDFNISFPDFLNEYTLINNKTNNNFDSFQLFLDKFIKQTLLTESNNINSEKELNGALNILNQYFVINNKSYDNINLSSDNLKIKSEAENNRKTMIYLDNNNIYLIKRFIEKTFLNDISSENGKDLLTLKKIKVNGVDTNLKYNSDYIFTLQKNITKRLNTINDIKNTLAKINNTKNDFKEDYEKLISIFDKYFLVITDYSSYYNNYYNKYYNNYTNKPIESFVLNDEEFINYILSFNGIEGGFNYSNFTKKNDYYYTINNLIVKGTSLSFDVYPFDGNKINNIYVGGKYKPYSYKLDYEKEKIDSENIRNGNNNTKKRFEDFFIYTFASSNNEVVKTEEKQSQPTITTNEVYDTEIIRVFKRDTLLYGKFANLNKYIDIKYNNILVKELSTLVYDIKIKGAKFKNLDIVMNCDYNIEENIFNNIVLNTDSFNITINENMNLDIFNKKIGLLLENYEKINKINTNLINSAFGNIDTIFYPIENNIIITANKKSKGDFYIDIGLDGNLNEAILRGKNLIKENKSYDDFIINLPTILN